MLGTRKTAFIYIVKNVQLNLYAFFCLDPINVCKSISMSTLFSFIIIIIFSLRERKVLLGTKPQNRRSLLWEVWVRNTHIWETRVGAALRYAART
jgi:hypothetical protein